MNITTKCFLIGAVALGVASCAKDEGFSGFTGEKGGITLNLSTDGRVMNLTRSDDGTSPVVPEVSAFGVGLHKHDGSYSKTWNKLDDFNGETEFPIGDYDIEAIYGDIEKEGFDTPYYYGLNQVHVAPNANSNVSVVAALANSMVSFRYTEAFKNYFMAYNGAVQTPGHDYVLFAQDEERPAYIKPSDVKINLTLTNGQGKTVTIQPAGFTAEPRHHYVVTFNVNADPQGNMTLDVQFDDTVIAEVVNVSLGDDLFDAPAPTVTPDGFVSGELNNAFELAAYPKNAKFNVYAFGGLKEANLNIISGAQYAPEFGERIDLMKATTLQQQQLENSGLGCYGFYRNPDKMAVLDLQGFIGHLPIGRHTISLQVADAMTRVSEPVEFVVEIAPIQVEMKAAKTSNFMATELMVDVYTNCRDIRYELGFEAPDENNRMVQANVKNSQSITVPAESTLPYAIRYVLEVSPLTNPTVDVRALLGHKTFDAVLAVAEPVYSLSVDAYAHRAEIRIDGATQDMKDYIIRNTKVYNGNEIITTNVVNDTERDVFIFTNLTESTSYENFRLSVSGFEKNVPAFTTEAATDVPNGNFSNLIQTIKLDPIDAGGQWRYTAFGSATFNTSAIIVNEPVGWSSINKKTCYTESHPLNTWFVVPSTMAVSGEVTIRSVAYDHNGTLPNVDYFSNVRPKFNRSAPASFSSRAAGELFLGSYNYDGAEHREDRISFMSRPNALTFEYYATPEAGEHGAVELILYGEDNQPLQNITQPLMASGTWTSVNIDLSDYPFGKKASKLYMRFISSTANPVAITVPSGDSLDDVGHPTNTSSTHINANEYKSLATGSELKIKNVHFGYDVSNVTGKSLRKK